MSAAKPETVPQDFLEVFTVTDATGQPAVIAGGQAVNLWALAFPLSELLASPLVRVRRFLQRRFLPDFPSCAPPPC